MELMQDIPERELWGVIFDQSQGEETWILMGFKLF